MICLAVFLLVNKASSWNLIIDALQLPDTAAEAIKAIKNTTTDSEKQQAHNLNYKWTIKIENEII